ncbi:hypothetical protein FZEAL_5431 [Fusarium zealandicum]|uniref:Uncharacterized protein n=1 Tax=Fusarium zealandicum TaxID=1053134 RepID=A0A8H4UKR8_9HYPO|nr:hypothetical protein FZEAL_5431 [Fusarium zealandicum]
MDAISNLPPELRMQIMLSFETAADLQLLTHASPVIFHDAQASRQIIRDTYLGDRFQRSLLQDAVALAAFPKINDLKHGHAAVEIHLDRWGSKTLPDPVEDFSILCAVDTLACGLEVHMSEYLVQATKPDYSSLSHARRMRDSLPDSGHTSTTLEKLTPLEQNRLARAFLRHQIIFKMFMFKLKRGGDPEEDPFGPHSFYCDWAPLLTYEHERSFSHDIDMLQCVHEHLRTLFRDGNPWRRNRSTCVLIF